MKNAYFAGGCFWCITPVFMDTEGVKDVVSGFSGGIEKDPSYEDVKHQLTGHRETVKITYDEAKVTYGQLLDIFLTYTDPFDGEGQFIDRGRSYTLAVYYETEEEREITEEKLKELKNASGRDVFVAVEAFTAFYDAEDYHQHFYLTHPEEFEEELISSGRKAVQTVHE